MKPYKKITATEAYKEYLIARQTIIDSAKGFKPDWKDNEQVKYSVSYDYYKNKYFINEQGNYQDFGVIYFATEEDAEASRKIFPNEWEMLRVWGQRREKLNLEAVALLFLKHLMAKSLLSIERATGYMEI